MLQNLLPVFDSLADFQQIAIGGKAVRNLQYVTAVLGWKILPFPLDQPILVGPDIELLPKFGSTRVNNLVRYTEYAYEEVGALIVVLVFIYCCLDRGHSAFFSQR